MKSLGAGFQAQLDAATRYGALLFTFFFPEGTYGVWTGNGPTTDNGVNYVNASSIFNVGTVQYQNDGSVAQFGFTINPNDKGLTGDAMLDFFTKTWHMQRITAAFGVRDPVTDLVISRDVFFDGLMSKAPFKKGKGGRRIEVECLSWAIIASQAGNKYRNNSTQQLFDNTDTSLVGIGELVGNIKKTLKWGQTT